MSITLSSFSKGLTVLKPGVRAMLEKRLTAIFSAEPPTPRIYSQDIGTKDASSAPTPGQESRRPGSAGSLLWDLLVVLHFRAT